jgi:peptidoglycan-associated lipoprotein
MHRRWEFLGAALCILLILAAAGCQKKVIDAGSAVSTQPRPSGGAQEPGLAEDGMGEEDLAGRSRIDEGPTDEIVTADGVVMNRERFINQDIFFEFDSSELSAEARSILKAKAEWMARNAHLNIIIEGHCDNRGTTEYNLALGERRAEGVKRFMQDLGITDERIRTISFGEERPLATGDDEQAWARNRRAHFEFD